MLEEEYIDSIKEDILNTSFETKNWQSQPDIHKNIKYKPLVDKINHLSTKIFESLDYHVIKLDLVFFGGLTKKDIPRKKSRFLSEEEINILKRL